MLQLVVSRSPDSISVEQRGNPVDYLHRDSGHNRVTNTFDILHDIFQPG